MNGLLHRLARQIIGPPPLTARARTTPRFATQQDVSNASFNAALPSGDDANPAYPSTAPLVARRNLALEAPPTMPDHTSAAPARQVGSDDERIPRPIKPTAGTPLEVRTTSTRSPETVQAHVGVENLPLTAAQRPAAVMPRAPDAPHKLAAWPDALPQLFATQPQALPSQKDRARDIRKPRTGFGPREASTPGIRIDGTESANLGVPVQPNEVHVHIGRIEVTALREAPQPRARERSGRKPMSLEEYLLQRQKGQA